MVKHDLRAIRILWISGNFNEISVPLNLTKAEPVGAEFQGFWLKMPLTISKLHFKIHQYQYSNGETWFTCAPYYFYEYLAILMKSVYPLNLTKVEPVGAGFQGFCLKMPLTTSKLHFKIHQDQFSNGETWFTCAPYYFYEYLAILNEISVPPKFDQSRTRRGWISRILAQNASNHLKIALIRMVKHDLRPLPIIFMNIWQF